MTSQRESVVRNIVLQVILAMVLELYDRCTCCNLKIWCKVLLGHATDCTKG